MRYTIQQYGQTLAEALAKKSSDAQRQIIRRFLKILQRQRALPLLPQIMRRCEQALLRAAGARALTITSASALRPRTREEILRLTPQGFIAAERVNPNILAGMQIIIDNEILIDASGSRMIKKLFLPARR